MRRVMGYILPAGRQGLLVIGITFLLITHYPPLITVHASEPATTSASLLEKLNTLKKEIASKAATLKTEINKKLTNKFIAGQINTLTDTTIAITTKNGNKTISVDQYTVYQNNVVATKKGVRKNQITLKSFTEGDFIYALGDVDDKQILVAKKIIKADPPKTENRSFVWGKVISTIPGGLTLGKQDGLKIDIAVNSKTLIRREDGELVFSDLIPGSIIVAAGEKDGSSFKASFIYRIPTAFKKVGEKLATPSSL